MFKKKYSFKKAAILFAAFFILKIDYSLAQSAKKLELTKEKAKALLFQKKKTEAIELMVDFLKIEQNKQIYSEAAQVLTKISQTFISKDAQDAYESSLNYFKDNTKESLKSIEICINLEPQNIDCHIQKIKIQMVDKNKSDAEKTFEEIFKYAKGTVVASWLEAYLNKENNTSIFKTKSLIKSFNDKPTEEFFILSVLEIERAFAVKNFSRAKDGLEFLEKKFPEYPDLSYFKQKLDFESSEEKQNLASEPNLIYATKCKNLSRSVARKFRYDFNLCLRGF